MRTFAETPRLLLREMTLADVDDYFALDSDPEVHRFLGNHPLHDRAQAGDVIRYVRQQYADNGIGRWAVVDKATGAFMGWSGLKLVRETVNGQTDYYDLGYRLMRRYWGQGFASESALASLQYGFEALGLSEIFAAAHTDNAASNHLLRKIGMQYQHPFSYDGATHLWYRIRREEWPGHGAQQHSGC